MRLRGPEPFALDLEVVERQPPLQGRGRDFALSLRVQTPELTFRGDGFWVEQEAYGTFLGEMGELARTRSGRAILRFMSPHLLELFAVAGTSDLLIHGHFQSALPVGGGVFPTVLDFSSILGSEHVEQAFADLRALADGSGLEG